MDSDDDNIEDNKPNQGIQKSEDVKASNTREATSSRAISIPSGSRNPRVADTSRFQGEPSTSSWARRLEQRPAVVHPQVIKATLFGYSFWLYPVGPFQFLDFGRQYISSAEDRRVQEGRDRLLSRMLGAGYSSTSNPGNRNNTVTKKAESNDPSTSQVLETEMKKKENSNDPGEKKLTGMSSSKIKKSDKSEDDGGAAARPAKSDKDVKKSNDDKNVASGSASSFSSCAGPSGTQPGCSRKKVEEMNGVEMDENFRYLCEDDGVAPPRPPEPVPDRRQPEVPPRQVVRRGLEDDEERIEFRRQMREFNEGIRPFMEYCNALLRDELPSPDYSEDSDDEHEWLGPPVSRRSRRIPPIPDLDAIFNIRRFPDIDVFPHGNLVFISIRRHDGTDNEMVRVNNVDYVFPDYCVETTSRQGALTAWQILITSIDNFCNLRVAQRLPLDSFDRDFNSFLATVHQGGTLYQIGMCRIRLGWHHR